MRALISIGLEQLAYRVHACKAANSSIKRANARIIKINGRESKYM